MFSDRLDAGKKLAQKILPGPDSIVLAIPRGGIVLGNMISQKINCPLDIVISKKVTPPDYPEYAIGAIVHDGTLYKSQYWSRFCDDPKFANELVQKQTEVKNRLEKYRGHAKYDIQDKRVILVDDGIATGSTVFAILNWIKKQNPKKITLAIPVMPPETFENMKNLVDEIIVLDIPEDFSAVGQFYEDFSQVSDEQVMKILRKYH